MKVWMNKYTGSYGGGMILAIAQCEAEADWIASTNERIGDHYRYNYDPKNWKEVPELMAKVMHPTIVAMEDYFE